MKAAGFTFQAEGQLGVFQQREEPEILLPVDDDAVAVGQQPPSGLHRMAVQSRMPLLQQVKLQQAVGRRREHRLARH